MNVGWAQRERLAREAALEVKGYTVRRWTAFEWQETEGEDRKQREQKLARIAGLVLVQLRKRAPDCDASIEQVRIEGKPQLKFELTVQATDEEDARRRAMYRIGRALSVKVPTGRGRREAFSRYHNRGKGGVVSVPDAQHLSPPWGAVEITERSSSRRTHGVRPA